MVIRTHLTVRVAIAAAVSISPLCIGATGQAQAPAQAPAARPASTPAPAPASGSDPQFKVRLDFNRWHDHAELKADFQRLEKAWPKFLKYSSLGMSHGKREIMMVTVNNPDTGPESGKPAMYIEANVHGNEIQGAEVALYTVWYLMENYGRIDQITKLVNERVFYVVPTVNPDGRDHFLKGTGAGSRTGHVPVDDDSDGAADEDGDDDLNGNGVIEQIRKYVPGAGDASQERGRSEAARSRAGGRGRRLCAPRQRGHRQRRRRPGERRSGRRLRRQSQLGVQLAAELHPVRVDGLSRSSCRKPRPSMTF